VAWVVGGAIEAFDVNWGRLHASGKADTNFARPFPCEISVLRCQVVSSWEVVIELRVCRQARRIRERR
jgi:hypothetical protein